MNTLLQTIFTKILSGNRDETLEAVKESIEASIDPARILNEGMIAAMNEVGKRFENGDYFVPEMLISARAMQAGLSYLKPYLIDSDVKSAGKVAIGTVKGDLHDIGKNLVAMMLEGAGFEVIDLGVDVPPEKFVDAISTENVDIVGLSALLTTTMPNMEATIKAITEAGFRDQVKIIIGGAPVNKDYANQISADGFSQDASRAVSLAHSLIGGA